MTHTYEVNGMTCSHCEARVKKAIESHPSITDAKVSHTTKSAEVNMTQHVSTEDLQQLIGQGYTISDKK